MGKNLRVCGIRLLFFGHLGREKWIHICFSAVFFFFGMKSRDKVKAFSLVPGISPAPSNGYGFWSNFLVAGTHLIVSIFLNEPLDDGEEKAI